MRGCLKMFKYNDKMVLSLINVKDIAGNIIPFNLTLPSNDEIDYNLLKDAVSIEVHEYLETEENSLPSKVFTIYVGFYGTLATLYDPNNKLKKQIKGALDIESITSPVCYTVKGDTQIVFASLQPGDVLVNNLNELEIIIKSLNASVQNITSEIDNVKNLSRILK